jgi:hypothetical protein
MGLTADGQLIVDQSYHYEEITTDVDGSTIVTSASIETSLPLLLYQGSSYSLARTGCFHVPDADLYIYGDVVMIHGRLKLPGKKIRIVCRELRAEMNGTEPAAIIVDGRDGRIVNLPLPKAGPGGDGADSEYYTGYISQAMSPVDFAPKTGGQGKLGSNGTDGADGIPGGHGGDIVIVCESYLDDGGLLLSAQGGRGSDGQKGQDGGDGGRGGAGKDDVWQDGNRKQYPSFGGMGGIGGNGGKGGNAGRGGDGGTITFLVGKAVSIGNSRSGPPSVPGQPPSARGGMQALLTFGYNGIPGNGGKKGGLGDNGRDGTYRELAGVELRAPKPLTWEAYDELMGEHQARGGFQAGVGGAPNEPDPPRDGDSGAPVTGLPKWGTATVRTASHGDIAELAHVSQLLMLFHSARMDYLAAGETLTSVDALRSALTRLQFVRDVLTAKAPTNRPDDWKALLRRVKPLIHNILTGVNYFGMRPNYVPRQSLSGYLTALDASLGDLKTMEDAYNSYFEALRENRATASHLVSVADALQAQSATCDEKLTKATTSLSSIEKAIEQDNVILATAREKLQSKIADYQKAILEAFGQLEASQLFDIIGQLSFTPEHMGDPRQSLMVGSQVGKLADAAMTASDEYQTDAGAVKKQYIVHTIDAFGTSVNSLSEAYRTARDMSVQLDDPNAYKLLMKKSEFEQMCDKFYTSGFKDDAVAREAARDAMSYYVDQVQIRNADVMAYNVALSTIRDLSSRKSELDLKISEKDSSLARVAEPGLAVYAAFVGDAYEQAKESCLWDLYQAARASVYWLLQPYDLFKDVLGGRHPSEVDHTVISNCQDAIHGKLKDGEKAIANPPQSFDRFSISLKDLPGVLEILREQNRVNFYVPSAGQEATKDESPFAGLADVRITKVRAWAFGFKAGSNRDRLHQHTIVLHHLGEETIVDKSGNEHNFTHEPVPLTIAYDADKIGDESAFLLNSNRTAMDGTLTDDEGGTTFARISPFAQWSIAILPEDNYQPFDIVGLKDVRIDFYGGARTMEGR